MKIKYFYKCIEYQCHHDRACNIKIEHDFEKNEIIVWESSFGSEANSLQQAENIMVENYDSVTLESITTESTVKLDLIIKNKNGGV